jgi:small RNA 2'-O-methyltransferase
VTSWLHEERLRAAHHEIRASGARSVLDLGCGDGDLLMRLAEEPEIDRIVGIDLCAAALKRLRLRIEAHGVGQHTRIDLHRASFVEADRGFKGFDCAALIETIEHVETDALSTLERSVFYHMRPRSVVITTPNAEFNDLLGVPVHRFRHSDHRFEWSRQRFANWSGGVARRNGYRVTCRTIGGFHPILGGASQMAVFSQPTSN